MKIRAVIREKIWITILLLTCIIVAGASAGTILAAATSSTTLTPAQQQRLATIKSRGDEEIGRRLASLQNVFARINNAAKLTSSDKSYLIAEVNTEISGLTALRSALDAETTLSGARTDAQSIFKDYRVYALLFPKIWLVRVSNDQQVVESKLQALATKLQTRITTDQNAGKNVANLQSDLNDMTTQIKNAQSISLSIEQKVLPLQPSDYNTDHALLSGDNIQLKQAHTDNMTAYGDAKTIISALKSL